VCSRSSGADGCKPPGSMLPVIEGLLPPRRPSAHPLTAVLPFHRPITLLRPPMRIVRDQMALNLRALSVDQPGAEHHRTSRQPGTTPRTGVGDAPREFDLLEVSDVSHSGPRSLESAPGPPRCPTRRLSPVVHRTDSDPDHRDEWLRYGDHTRNRVSVHSSKPAFRLGRSSASLGPASVDSSQARAPPTSSRAGLSRPLRSRFSSLRLPTRQRRLPLRLQRRRLRQRIPRRLPRRRAPPPTRSQHRGRGGKQIHSRRRIPVFGPPPVIHPRHIHRGILELRRFPPTTLICSHPAPPSPRTPGPPPADGAPTAPATARCPPPATAEHPPTAGRSFWPACRPAHTPAVSRCSPSTGAGTCNCAQTRPLAHCGP
jgi:hypothetical protein